VRLLGALGVVLAFFGLEGLRAAEAEAGEEAVQQEQGADGEHHEELRIDHGEDRQCTPRASATGLRDGARRRHFAEGNRARKAGVLSMIRQHVAPRSEPE
jgi:hypothetical protein